MTNTARQVRKSLIDQIYPDVCTVPTDSRLSVTMEGAAMNGYPYSDVGSVWRMVLRSGIAVTVCASTITVVGIVPGPRAIFASFA